MTTDLPSAPEPDAASDPPTAPDDVRLVGDVLLDAADHLRAAFTRACAAHDLTMSEGRALRFLARGARQADLADLLSCSPPRVTAVLQGLEARGLVRRRRSVGDRRQMEVAVTAAGDDALHRVHAVLDRTSPLVLGLTGPDREVLVGLLRRLVPDVGSARSSHLRAVAP